VAPSALRNPDELATAHRIIVKVGSSTLTGPDGNLDLPTLNRIVDVIAERWAAGTQVVLVSSGAISTATGPLGFTKRPRDLATQQAAASVGQGLLLTRYSEAFACHNLHVGQVLLTLDDIVRRRHYTNAQRALTRLLALGVVPIINENDTVATDEIRFGDNDRLAALVSHLVKADALILVTDVDALYDRPPSRPGAQRISRVENLSEVEGIDVTGRTSGFGTGGMITKLESVRIATGSGLPVVLTNEANLARAIVGESVGTWFAATGRRMPTRQLWIAYAAHPRGQLTLDEGAVAALVGRGKSLLPAGITAVSGTFDSGDVVELADSTGFVVARGVSTYSSRELPQLLGHSTAELRETKGRGWDRVAVHRDDMAVRPSLLSSSED